MFFVPTLAEMIEAMKIQGLKPPTIADDEVTMRRLLRAPRDENGELNFVQEWVKFRGKVHTWWPDLHCLSTFEAVYQIWREGYFVDTPNEEVAELLDKLVKEQKRANLRHKKHQKERVTRELAPDDS